MFALLDSHCDVERQRLGTSPYPLYMIYWTPVSDWVIITDGRKEKPVEKERWDNRLKEADEKIIGITTSEDITITKITPHAVAATFVRQGCTIPRMVRVLRTADEVEYDKKKGYYRYYGESIIVFVDHKDGTVVTVFPE